jgi:hypothetical protein
LKAVENLWQRISHYGAAFRSATWSLAFFAVLALIPTLFLQLFVARRHAIGWKHRTGPDSTVEWLAINKVAFLGVLGLSWEFGLYVLRGTMDNE